MQRFGYEIADYPHAASLDATLKKVLRAYCVDGVVDVGARRGDFGVLLRQAGFGGPILSFEPVTESFEELAQRAQGDRDWRCFNCALGSKNESSTIHVTNRTNLCSIRRPNDFGVDRFGEGVAVNHEQAIEIRRLDTFLQTDAADFPAGRLLLKTDTQGWDMEVVHGAAGVLDRVVALLSEMAIRSTTRRRPSLWNSSTITDLWVLSRAECTPSTETVIFRLWKSTASWSSGANAWS